MTLKLPILKLSGVSRNRGGGGLKDETATAVLGSRLTETEEEEGEEIIISRCLMQA